MTNQQRWVFVPGQEPYRTRRRTPEQVITTERESHGRTVVFQNEEVLVFADPVLDLGHRTCPDSSNLCPECKATRSEWTNQFNAESAREDELLVKAATERRGPRWATPAELAAGGVVVPAEERPGTLIIRVHGTDAAGAEETVMWWDHVVPRDAMAYVTRVSVGVTESLDVPGHDLLSFPFTLTKHGGEFFVRREPELVEDEDGAPFPDTSDPARFGRVAYGVYRDAVDGVSVTGDQLPDFDALSRRIASAWNRTGQAVAEAVHAEAQN